MNLKYCKTSGVYHYFIAKKLRERCEPFKDVMPREKVKRILGIYHVPSKIQNKFLEEMQTFGFVKKKHQKAIQILVMLDPVVKEKE